MSNIDNSMIETKINNRKMYTYHSISYYKVIGKNKQYFIKVEDYYTVTLRQKSVYLFEMSISGLKKVKGYVKSIDSSDILLIAAPSIYNNFIMYDLEKTA